MRYSLRAATDADYDFLYSLNEATMREYVVQAFGGWDDAFHAQLFRERFDPSKIRVVVVADRDVGMVETETTHTEMVLWSCPLLVAGAPGDSPAIQGHPHGQNGGSRG